MAVRKAPEDRREELLDAALRLIGRKGFAAVTLRDVAAEVGVAHGLIRHYFQSRGALLAAAFDRVATEEVEGLPDPAAGDPLAQLADICRTSEDCRYPVWIDAWAEAPRDTEVADALRRHHRSFEDHLRRVVESAVRTGDVAHPDPASAASALTSLLDGLAVQLHALRILDPPAHDRLALGGAESLLGLPAGTLAAH